MASKTTGQMVGRAISLTPAHDAALLKLAQERDMKPSRLVRFWIANTAARQLGLTIKEPKMLKPGRKVNGQLWMLRKMNATKQARGQDGKFRQLKLKLQKGAYKKRR